MSNDPLSELPSRFECVCVCVWRVLSRDTVDIDTQVEMERIATDRKTPRNAGACDIYIYVCELRG